MVVSGLERLVGWVMEVAWVVWSEAGVGCLSVLVVYQAVVVCLAVVLRAAVEFAQTEAVMSCLSVAVNLVGWVEAGVVCLVVVVENPWVIVGPLVGWVGAMVGCLAVLMGSL